MLFRSLKGRGPTEADREWLVNHARQNPRASQVGLAAIPQNEAINNWIDKQLTRYVKNQMGTKEDPIRASADKGILHYEPRGGEVLASAKRQLAGLNTDPISTTPYGIAWENVADAAIFGAPYRMHLPMISAEDAPDALRALGVNLLFRIQMLWHIQ